MHPILTEAEVASREMVEIAEAMCSAWCRLRRRAISPARALASEAREVTASGGEQMMVLTIDENCVMEMKDAAAAKVKADAPEVKYVAVIKAHAAEVKAAVGHAR